MECIYTIGYFSIWVVQTSNKKKMVFMGNLYGCIDSGSCCYPVRTNINDYVFFIILFFRICMPCLYVTDGVEQ